MTMGKKLKTLINTGFSKDLSRAYDNMTRSSNRKRMNEVSW